jgi:hypothetical protein
MASTTTLVLIVTLLSILATCGHKSQPNTIIVAAYFPWWTPEGVADFAQLESDAPRFRSDRLYVILNPASGPGPADWGYAPNVAALGQSLQASRQVPIGYVWTDYGNRADADVKADIDGWISIYGSSVIRGFFFDGCADSVAQLPIYTAWATYARNALPTAKIVVNPGWASEDAAAYLDDVADMVMAYESTGASYMAWGSSEWPSWWKSDRSTMRKICVTTHSYADWSQVKGKARSERVGCFHSTSRTLAENPYLRLSPEWAAIVDSEV